MIATWRLIAAVVLAVLAYLLSRPVMEALLIAIRRRLGKGFQCVFLSYLSVPTLCGRHTPMFNMCVLWR